MANRVIVRMELELIVTSQESATRLLAEMRKMEIEFIRAPEFVNIDEVTVENVEVVEFG